MSHKISTSKPPFLFLMVFQSRLMIVYCESVWHICLHSGRSPPSKKPRNEEVTSKPVIAMPPLRKPSVTEPTSSARKNTTPASLPSSTPATTKITAQPPLERTSAPPTEQNGANSVEDPGDEGKEREEKGKVPLRLKSPCRSSPNLKCKSRGCSVRRSVKWFWQLSRWRSREPTGKIGAMRSSTSICRPSTPSTTDIAEPTSEPTDSSTESTA